MSKDTDTLLLALLKRTDRRADGLAALRTRFPGVQEELLATAAHHLYGDGVEAAADWLVEIERTLQDPNHEICAGATFELLHHVYNWLQVQALLPAGTPALIEAASHARKALDGGDTDAAKEHLDEILERLSGFLDVPQVP